MIQTWHHIKLPEGEEILTKCLVNFCTSDNNDTPKSSNKRLFEDGEEIYSQYESNIVNQVGFSSSHPSITTAASTKKK